jgi:hypothetical protein
MKSSLLLFILYLYSACKGQKQVELNIVNRSHHPIDSLVISYIPLKFSEKIRSNETKIIEVNPPDFQGEFPLILTLYQSGKKFNAMWGSCNFGCTITNQHIYLFDQGITYKDEKPKEPEQLVLYIMDKTSSVIDSVVAKGIQEIKKGPSYFEITFDYKKLKTDPTLNVYSKNKIFNIKVSHDWDNWGWNLNGNKEFIYVYDNGESDKGERAMKKNGSLK